MQNFTSSWRKINQILTAPYKPTVNSSREAKKPLCQVAHRTQQSWRAHHQPTALIYLLLETKMTNSAQDITSSVHVTQREWSAVSQRTCSLLKPTSSKHTSCLFSCQFALWQILLFVCFVLFQNRVDVCLHKSSQTRNFSADMNNLLDKHEPANRFFFLPSLPYLPRQIYSSETQWAPGINSAPPPPR